MIGKQRRQEKAKRKSLFEWLLGLCGYEIWPATHTDPSVKGPPPRVLTREQVRKIKEFQQNTRDDGIVLCEGEE
jgi:hypothetical protein